MPPILRADHVTKSYAIAERQIAVLDDVSFAIAPGEFVNSWAAAAAAQIHPTEHSLGP
ncbi:MAG: hypothetical protein U0X20_05215 [Caldilineaceae bacterium]